jgi:hypothetical protein
MKTKTYSDGYLMIDNRGSPGLTPEDMAKLGLAGHPGYKGGQLYEWATMSCGHCARDVVLNPDRKRDRGWCSGCDRYVCDTCKAAGDCVPVEAMIDRLLKGTDT